MENINFINSEKYLKKSEGSRDFSETEIQESIQRLNIPLGKVEYRDSGQESVDIEGLRIEFSYSLLDAKSCIGVDNYLAHRGILDDKNLSQLDKWRVLDSMSFISDGVK